MRQHGRSVRPEEQGEQCTGGGEAYRLEHRRDTMGSYAAHARLDATRIGQEILDVAARIQTALVDAMGDDKDMTEKERAAQGPVSGTEWAERSGFRSSTDVRKLRSGALVATVTDLGVLRVLAPSRFFLFAEVIAQIAGGRLEQLQPAPVELNTSVAGLDLAASKLSSALLTATAPSSAGGVTTTPSERAALRRHLGEVKALAAEVEANLADDEGRR